MFCRVQPFVMLLLCHPNREIFILQSIYLNQYCIKHASQRRKKRNYMSQLFYKKKMLKTKQKIIAIKASQSTCDPATHIHEKDSKCACFLRQDNSDSKHHTVSVLALVVIPSSLSETNELCKIWFTSSSIYYHTSMKKMND